MTAQQFSDIMAWMKANELMLGLLASAIVITMPEKLPALKDFPQWMWSWFRDGSKTFLNFRHSGAPITDAQHSTAQALEVPGTVQIKVEQPITNPPEKSTPEKPTEKLEVDKKPTDPQSQLLNE